MVTINATIPIMDSHRQNQYFELYRQDDGSKIMVSIKNEKGVYRSVGLLETERGVDVRLQGRKAARVLSPAGADQTVSAHMGQLANEVTGSFTSTTLEHPTQEGFTLDHMYGELIEFDVTATLYQSREVRFQKLNELRENHTLLKVYCDFGAFYNMILYKVEPVLSSESANTFDVALGFKEVRKVELISPIIKTFVDADTTHADEEEDLGPRPLHYTEDKSFTDKTWWNIIVDGFEQKISSATRLATLWWNPAGALANWLGVD